MLLLNLSHHLPSLVCRVVDADASAAWVCSAAPVFAWDPAVGGIRKRNDSEEEKMTHRTAVFAAVSERNKATKRYGPGARGRVLNDLTVE